MIILRLNPSPYPTLHKTQGWSGYYCDDVIPGTVHEVPSVHTYVYRGYEYTLYNAIWILRKQCIYIKLVQNIYAYITYTHYFKYPIPYVLCPIHMLQVILKPVNLSLHKGSTQRDPVTPAYSYPSGMTVYTSQQHEGHMSFPNG